MSAQNPNASIAAVRADTARATAGLVAPVVAAGWIAVVALSALRAGAAPAIVAASSVCFACLLMPLVVLGTRPDVIALRREGPRFRRRDALPMMVAIAGLAGHAAVLRLDPRVSAGISLERDLQLLGLALVLTLVTVVRPLPGIGYSFALGRRDLLAAVAAFAAFAAIGIPLGLAAGFIHYGWRPFDALGWARRGFYFLFLVALPEELVFRGFVQNGLERLLRARPWPLALLVASLVFGAAHLGHPPVPNVRYGILAALAGVAYGWVWHRTRSITASALTHAAVDLVWVFAFGGP